MISLRYYQILAVMAAIIGGYSNAQTDDSWKLYDDSQVAEVYITIDHEDLDWMYANVYSDSLHPASFRFVNTWIDETVDSIGFRLRGNTSRGSAKKSFKVSFNTFMPGREFHGIDKMNLNGEHNDPSIVRSKLCWDIFQSIGMTASRAAHTRVYVNGDYYGLYISIEHIDDEFLRKNYTDDSGNLWKCLWPANLEYLGSDPDLYKFYSGDRQTYDLKTNETLDDYSALARLIDVINNTAASALPDSLEQILEVTEVLQYLAINVITGSWDDYRFLKNNYYLYHNPTEDRFHWIPYDYDNSFSIDWFDTDWSTIDPYVYANIDGTPRPLSQRLLANDQYRDLFTHFMDFYRENLFLLPLWEDRIDSLHAMITPWAELDTWRTLDYGFDINNFHNSYTAGHYDSLHVKQGLKQYINQRNASLTSQFQWTDAAPIVYDIDWQPQNPGPADTVRITASVFGAVGLDSVLIYYHPNDLTVVLTYPMVFSPVIGSKRVEQADRWVGSIPPLGLGGYGRFGIAAEDNIGQTGIYPRSGMIELHATGYPSAELVINEFMADNDNVVPDEVGEYDDWLEIYNPTDQDVFLSGMYLSDNPDNLDKWLFPFGGVALEAWGHLLVWCDEDQEQGALHTNFKLSASGEFIALVDTDGVTIIDSLYFGPQSTDQSYGRNPDGSDNWQIVAPTPGAANYGLGVDEIILPNQFSVAAWPNPFNGQVTFTIEQPGPGNIKLSIFDLLGRRVSSYQSVGNSTGSISLQWNAQDNQGNEVATGVYLYRIEYRSDNYEHSLVKQGKLLYLK